MAKRLRIIVLDRARLVILQLTESQRAQFDRLIAALRLAPRAGVYYAADTMGRTLYQVSSADLHLVYTLVYTVQEDRLLIVSIEVAPWTPQHLDMP